MSFTYAQRTSSHPFVDAVWRGQAYSDEPYWVSADGCWDIIFARAVDGKTRAFISGPMTQAELVSQPVGTELIGVRFKPGSFIPSLLPGNMVDTRVELGDSSTKRFWLEGVSFDTPDYGNAEDCVHKLVRLGLLYRDAVVAEVLAGHSQDVTTRTLQRHFINTAGLSAGFIDQIQRAQQAERLLSTGETISSVAQLAGYADHAHMTRSFKRIVGRTPSELLNAG
ncbi:MAG TPA: AraC family transcriptional regulator [Candidatus Saccharimonadia bacterium]|nr:AraC family transcriptional regulator [Candidatus Saccharimonadia bacterium]